MTGATAVGREPIRLGDLPIGRPLSRPIQTVGGTATLLAAGQVLTPARLEAMRRAGVTEVVVGESPGRGAERSLVSRRVSVDALFGAAGDTGVSTPVRLDRDAISALDTAGVKEIEVLVDPSAPDAPPAVAPGQPPAGRMLGIVLRGNRRTRRPETRARDIVVGRRAADAFDQAIETVAWSTTAAELMLASGLRPAFLGPAVETALMVATVGARRGWDDARLVHAAVAGLFADIGMLQIPDDLLFKPGVLSREEHEVMRRHTELGATVLEPLAGTLGPEVATTALQHHERLDGAGYPAGLRGGEISEVAQVVSMSHLYLAATLGRSYRGPLSPATVLDLIERMAGHAWDPRLVRAFIDSIAPYPVGTLVRLSTGECGSVVTGGAPLAPLVQVRWAADGALVQPRLVTASGKGSGIHVVAVGD